jgi:hypothetical protein
MDAIPFLFKHLRLPKTTWTLSSINVLLRMVAERCLQAGKSGYQFEFFDLPRKQGSKAIGMTAYSQ